MKKILSVILAMSLILLLVSCSGKSTVSNNTINTSNVETATKKAAEDKAAELDKRAMDGYKLFFDKKYAEAIAVENEVIKEDPTFCKAYYIKGITECYNNNYKDGSKDIDKALSLNPNDYMARFNKALSLELYAHYDEAIIWYNKALEIQKEEWSYYGIASIYGRRGDAQNAVKYLKLAIALNPDIKQDAKNEADFNPIKNNKEFTDVVNK